MASKPTILAIDPGTTESGLVWLDGDNVLDSAVFANNELLDYIHTSGHSIVIEMISSYGMPVGRETFETVVWIGRFWEACNSQVHRLYRRDVKQHFCHSARAKDANIWQALLDRYGGKERAVGRKASPGPLYGVASHCRAALAVGLAWNDGVRSPELDNSALVAR